MYASRIVRPVLGVIVLIAGCARDQQATSPSGYEKNMAAIERWISESPTFREFEQQLAATQRPTFYVDMKFERFTPDPNADLASMRSAQRRSSHEVVISGAARTQAREGVQYRIVIDESVEGK
jgi:hypothetical protein